MQTLFLIYYMLIGTIHVVLLFAIWRALLGKSSIDAKVGTQMNILSKSVDKLGSMIGTNSDKNSENSKRLKELAQTLQNKKLDEN